MTDDPDKSGEIPREKSDTADSDCMRWVAEFSADLRQMWEQAGKPSSRQMSRKAGYSHTALLGALSGSGGRLPSRDLTLGLVRACGGDEQDWLARWQKAHARITADREVVKISVAAHESPEVHPGPSWQVRWRIGAASIAPVIIVIIGVAVTQSTSGSQISSTDQSTAGDRKPPLTQSTTRLGPGSSGQNFSLPSFPSGTGLGAGTGNRNSSSPPAQSTTGLGPGSGGQNFPPRSTPSGTGLGAGTGNRNSFSPLAQSNTRLGAGATLQNPSPSPTRSGADPGIQDPPSQAPSVASRSSTPQASQPAPQAPTSESSQTPPRSFPADKKCKQDVEKGHVYTPCMFLVQGTGEYYGTSTPDNPGGVVEHTLIVQECTVNNTNCTTASATHGYETDHKNAAHGWAYKACGSAKWTDGQQIVFACSDLIGYPV